MQINVHKSVCEINTNQWDELINHSSTASFFQTKECYDFYASLSFMQAFVFGVSENDKLVGVLCGYVIADGNFVKRYFSRRAIVPGGVLIDANISDKALQTLLDYAKNELSHKAIYIEIRNYNDYSAFRPVFEKVGFAYQPHLNFHVPTPYVETALKQLSSSKRRQIKLSFKAGATIGLADTSEDIKQFYDLLEELYRNKVRTPFFPNEFFYKLAALRSGRIFVVKFKEKVIGGIACVLFDKNTVYEWFVCGDDGLEKNLYPSVLATWAGIEYAATNGFERFDFMGAGKPEENYGVRDFKSKFGGELVEHGRFLYICKPLLYTLGKFIVQKLKRAK